MAAIYRKNGTKNLYCTYTGADGIKRHRSTGEPKRSDALRKALELEAEAKAIKAAETADQQKILTVVQEASELALGGKLTQTAGRELVNRMLEATGQGSMEFFTIKQWFETWLEGKESTASEATAERYRTSINNFLKFIGKDGKRHLEFINERHLIKWQKQLTEKFKATTVNGYIKDVGQALRKAHKAGYIRANPYGSITLLPQLDSVAKKPFENEEIRSLLDFASDDWRGVILLGCYTGMRLSDAANLTGGNVDLKELVIDYMPKKTRRKNRWVKVPMHPELIDYFNDVTKPKDEAAPLFESLAGKKSAALSKQFRKIMAEAGVDPEYSQPPNGRRTTAKSFHSTRHTAASMLANMGVSSEIREAIVGHTDSETHKKYTHLQMDTLREGIDKMPAV